MRLIDADAPKESMCAPLDQTAAIDSAPTIEITRISREEEKA